ncbi:hypothetical protein H7Y21_01075 [Arenimonas sp.]|nr:hypothetical protein [Candidatus Parcubacteria bacterium]
MLQNENNSNSINPDQFSFDESRFKIRSRTVLNIVKVPAMIGFLIRIKIVKTENQAVGLLISMAAVFLGISVFIIIRSVAVPTAQINPNFITK